MLRALLLFLTLAAAAVAEVPTLAFQKEGRGSGVVLIHGFGGNRSVWAGQVERFKKLHTVLAVDLPGHGASAAPTLKDGAVDLDEVAQAVAQLIRKQKLAPAILVGHSMGGGLAVRVAKVDPGAVQGVILVDGFLAPLPAAFVDGLCKGLETDPTAALRGFLGGQASGPAQTDLLLKEALKVKVPVLQGYLRALGRGGLAAADLKGPSVLFASPNFIPDPEKEAESLARLGLAGAPKLQVQYFVNAKHWVMLDEPETFQVLFNDFETRVLAGE